MLPDNIILLKIHCIDDVLLSKAFNELGVSFIRITDTQSRLDIFFTLLNFLRPEFYFPFHIIIVLSDFNNLYVLIL